MGSAASVAGKNKKSGSKAGVEPNRENIRAALKNTSLSHSESRTLKAVALGEMTSLSYDVRRSSALQLPCVGRLLFLTVVCLWKLGEKLAPIVCLAFSKPITSQL
jgi:hypothetical protein